MQELQDIYNKPFGWVNCGCSSSYQALAIAAAATDAGFPAS
jgi:hypothetical protein